MNYKRNYGLGDTLSAPPTAAVSAISSGMCTGRQYNASLAQLAETLKPIVNLPVLPFSPLLKDMGFGAIVAVPAISFAGWATVGYFVFGKSVTAAIATPAIIWGAYFLIGKLANSECQPYVPEHVTPVSLRPMG